MFSTMKCRAAVLFVAELASLLWAEPTRAQAPGRQSLLSSLQQQNALQQQQNAVQTAVLQTTALVQTANRQNAAPNPLNFQQQQNALQMAQQQTTALLQTSYRQNSALSQTALGQLNTLQNALQQSITVQDALVRQNGQARRALSCKCCSRNRAL